MKTQNLDTSTEIIQHEYKGTSAESVQHHYDEGNEFYRLWLDDTMTYTCALWEEGEMYDALKTAQIRKLDFHIKQAKAKRARRVLDIGCGWGALLRRLVEVHDVEKAVGLTLSKAQAEWVKSLKNPQIEVYLENWSDHCPENPYDAILGVGILEHVARLELSETEKVKTYRHFFLRCHELLQPGGWMSLQTGVYGNMRREDFSQFIATEIFPESDYPRLADLAKASEQLFEIVAIRNDPEHYERTCKAWLSKLKTNRAAAVNLIGEEAVVRYEKYLNFCIIGFHIGTINLVRIAMRRIDNPRKAVSTSQEE
ncbi:MAG: class I SAM-dependent methyltransferase [Scytonema sp. RU_4_4]|nr:class I SAM-dependent methyltransferase [Scytonema sp. RU_4_4]